MMYYVYVKITRRRAVKYSYTFMRWYYNNLFLLEFFLQLVHMLIIEFGLSIN